MPIFLPIEADLEVFLDQKLRLMTDFIPENDFGTTILWEEDLEVYIQWLPLFTNLSCKLMRETP